MTTVWYEYTQKMDPPRTPVSKIEEITAEAEVGKIYNGKVARIVDFGAFVTILPGKDGLPYISQIADERVEFVTDYLSEGQEVEVVVLDLDQRGRIKLSIKEMKIIDSALATSLTTEVDVYYRPSVVITTDGSARVLVSPKFSKSLDAISLESSA